MLMLLAIGSASAQPQALTVEPGEKGSLPTLPTIAPLEEGHFAGLWLDRVGMTMYSSGWFDRYVTLDVPQPGDLGATTFGLEYRPHVETGSWTRYETLDNGGLMSIYFDELPDFSGFDIRLVIDDGPQQGAVSNEVSFHRPGGVTTKFGWWESEEMVKVMGSTIGTTFDLDAHVYRYYANAWHEDAVYSKADGYYRYKWYRQNPNTHELTQIAGADGGEYTTTIDDCGYELVMELTGDDEHCSLPFRYNFGEIILPVQASLAYIGNDGFVLNTDYAVPADCFTYNNECMAYGDENTVYVQDEPVPSDVISERMPGQYVFRLPMEEYEGVVYDLNIPGTMLTAVYLAEWNDPPTPWYRELQMMSGRYMGPLNVKPTFEGQPTQTTIEVYARNIDDEWELFATEEANAEEGFTFWELPTLGDGCLVKALSANGTLDTYYPNALLWTQATPVVPGNDEEWNPISISIVLQPTLPALTGTGVIEGTVTVNVPDGARRHAPADASGLTVLLQQKGGNIVATTETTATGSYRFENVPFGAYEVLLNIDGCTMLSTTEVTLSETNANASGIDYSVEGDDIVPAGGGQTTGIVAYPTSVWCGAVSPHQQVYDLQGRPTTAPSKKGIYIHQKKKILMH